MGRVGLATRSASGHDGVVAMGRFRAAGTQAPQGQDVRSHASACDFRQRVAHDPLQVLRRHLHAGVQGEAGLCRKAVDLALHEAARNPGLSGFPCNGRRRRSAAASRGRCEHACSRKAARNSFSRSEQNARHSTFAADGRQSNLRVQPAEHGLALRVRVVIHIENARACRSCREHLIKPGLEPSPVRADNHLTAARGNCAATSCSSRSCSSRDIRSILLMTSRSASSSCLRKMYAALAWSDIPAVAQDIP